MDVPASHMMEAIASDAVMADAYAWLCERRKDYAPDADIWHLRWRWAEVKPQIQAALRAGTYRLGAVASFQAGEETREVWTAQDALVLKATAIHRAHEAPGAPSLEAVQSPRRARRGQGCRPCGSRQLI